MGYSENPRHQFGSIKLGEGEQDLIAYASLASSEGRLRVWTYLQYTIYVRHILDRLSSRYMKSRAAAIKTISPNLLRGSR